MGVYNFNWENELVGQFYDGALTWEEYTLDIFFSWII